MTVVKPKILLLADKRDWAYDYAANAIREILNGEFEFQISYVAENPLEDAKAFDADLVHVFWWGETWHHTLGLPRERILKEVSSFRWREEAQFGPVDARGFAERYLADAGTIVTTSRKMQTIVATERSVWYTPNGVDPRIFYPENNREGPLRVGWAGNVNDACKGLKDIIMPACKGDYELLIAPGNVRSRDEMRKFYNQIDVYCVASIAEGQPMPLMESLACGCFPVTVNVGIVPEVVLHRDNGLIVERSVAAFRAALSWCNSNLDLIRQKGVERAKTIHATRNWQALAPAWRAAYQQALAGAKAGIP